MEIIQNENMCDRFVKMLMGGIVLFLLFYFFPSFSYPLNILFAAAMLFASAWMLITGLIGYCPLYNKLGISTKK